MSSRNPRTGDCRPRKRLVAGLLLVLLQLSPALDAKECEKPCVNSVCQPSSGQCLCDPGWTREQSQNHRGRFFVGRCQALLENEISISIKLVSREKLEVLYNFLVDGCADIGLDITQWTNTSRCHSSPNHQ